MRAVGGETEGLRAERGSQGVGGGGHGGAAGPEEC